MALRYFVVVARTPSAVKCGVALRREFAAEIAAGTLDVCVPILRVTRFIRPARVQREFRLAMFGPYLFVGVEAWRDAFWRRIAGCQETRGILGVDEQPFFMRGFTPIGEIVAPAPAALAPLRPGDEVRIRFGPLQGYSGRVVSRGLVALTMFGREIKARLPATFVEITRAAA